MTTTAATEITVQATEDAAVAARFRPMTFAGLTAALDAMTPKKRRQVQAAIARHSLRRRTADKAWSTETATILTTAGAEKVRIIPGDHGGWSITTYDESMTLGTDGIWIFSTEIMTGIPANTVWEDYYDAKVRWYDQAAAIEALLATI